MSQRHLNLYLHLGLHTRLTLYKQRRRNQAGLTVVLPTLFDHQFSIVPFQSRSALFPSWISFLSNRKLTKTSNKHSLTHHITPLDSPPPQSTSVPRPLSQVPFTASQKLSPFRRQQFEYGTGPLELGCGETGKEALA